MNLHDGVGVGPEGDFDTQGAAQHYVPDSMVARALQENRHHTFISAARSSASSQRLHNKCSRAASFFNLSGGASGPFRSHIYLADTHGRTAGWNDL